MIVQVAAGVTLGLTLGLTCVAQCAPILGPHIAAEHHNASRGLIASIYFSLGRLLAYLFLGLIIGFVGGYFLNTFASALVIIPLGIILMTYGFLISFGSKLRFASIICCGFSKVKSTFLLGMILGLRPCIPLIAALTYSATLSNIFESLVFMSSFWLGSTAYIPILGILAGTLTHFAILRSNVDRIRRISGIALIVVGLIFINQGIAYLFSQNNFVA